jgi:AcrR family transcriptional regulator
MDGEETRGARTEQLPRGFVASNERERILLAVTEVVSIAGYDAATLEDIASHAGTTIEVVTRYFPDKQSAFLAAYEEAVWQGIDRIMNATAGPEGFSARILAAFEAFVGFVVAEPAVASMCIVDVFAAGAAGIERRNMTLKGMAALIRRIADESLPPDAPRPPELYLRIVLGGISDIFREYLADGKIAQLPDAIPAMHYALVVPYVGPATALEEYERRQRSVR